MKVSYTLLAATALTFNGISTPHASDLMGTLSNAAGVSTVKAIITNTWDAGNHRPPTTWIAQPNHRGVGEWLSQGNHRTPWEWFKGVPSRNK